LRESLDVAVSAGLGGIAMAIDKLVAPLLRVPLFAGLKPLQLTEIARQAERISFRPGAKITTAGEPGDGAYLIVAGEAVRVSLDRDQAIEPGSLIGEIAMLTEHTYGATVIARGRVHALKITRSALHAQMRDDPPLADHFTRLLAERLTQVAAEMRGIDEMLAGAARRVHGSAATREPAAGKAPATPPPKPARRAIR
jgi:CRP/FNR family transcriptional regulator, cyclic AMP receptor protein